MFNKKTIIVLDVGNYNSEYTEKVPFKAVVTEVTENEIWVKSLATDKVYEVYYYQVLEALTIKEIEFLLDMRKYGYEA